jgi:hypothetical protein
MGLPGGARNFVISGYADYRHDNLYFARGQSVSLKAMEWEGRLKPLMPWSTLILIGAGLAAAAGLALALLV